eukprot:754282-Hanusia_phi.AAC.3
MLECNGLKRCYVLSSALPAPQSNLTSGDRTAGQCTCRSAQRPHPTSSDQTSTSEQSGRKAAEVHRRRRRPGDKGD